MSAWWMHTVMSGCSITGLFGIFTGPSRHQETTASRTFPPFGIRPHTVELDLRSAEVELLRRGPMRLVEGAVHRGVDW